MTSNLCFTVMRLKFFFFFYSLMYFNSKLTGTAQKTDNMKNMYLHVGQLS